MRALVSLRSLNTHNFTTGRARFSGKCNWKRRRSSLIAVSSDRPKNFVSFITVRM